MLSQVRTMKPIFRPCRTISTKRGGSFSPRHSALAVSNVSQANEGSLKRMTAQYIDKCEENGDTVIQPEDRLRCKRLHVPRVTASGRRAERYPGHNTSAKALPCWRLLHKKFRPVAGRRPYLPITNHKGASTATHQRRINGT